MRSQFNNIIKQSQNLATKSSVASRRMTTTSDPRKAFGLAVGTKNSVLEESFIQDSPIPNLEMPNANLFSYAFQDMQKWQHKTFTECGMTGKKYTYGQTMDGALRWAGAIKKLFPNNQNPTVAFISPNTPDYITMFYGTIAAGCIVSPINPLYTPNEIAFHLIDSNADLLVVDSILEPLADLSLKHSGIDIPVVVIGSSQKGRPNAIEIISDPTSPMDDPKDVDPQSTAFLPYSSGTTGRSKGVKLSHAAITNNLAMYMNKYICGTSPAEGDHQEMSLGLLPFFHVFGLMTTLLSSTLFGAKLVTMPKFDPTLFISILKKHRMTTLQIVPPLLQFISEFPMITEKDLSGIHSIIIGGAPLPEAIARAQKLKTPNALLQEGYGMTETLLAIGTGQGGERIGYCGQVLPNSRAKIIDFETGESLPPNTRGELCVQVPSMMSGYHNNEAATDATIDAEGWLHTGDVATYTDDGFFAIVDRIKELIKYKALQISPTELEETLRQLPEIEDVGVVGIKHDKFGEAPVAYIVKSEEGEDSLTEAQIHQHMRKNLAEHKQLNGGIVFVDELPKSPTGKLLRRLLKEMTN